MAVNGFLHERRRSWTPRTGQCLGVRWQVAISQSRTSFHVSNNNDVDVRDIIWLVGNVLLEGIPTIRSITTRPASLLSLVGIAFADCNSHPGVLWRPPTEGGEYTRDRTRPGSCGSIESLQV